MNKKDEYVNYLHSKIDEWNLQLDKLSAKADEVEAESRLEAHKQIEALKKNRRELEEKLEKIQESGESAWKDLKSGADLAFESMSQAVQSALGRFK